MSGCFSYLRKQSDTNGSKAMNLACDRAKKTTSLLGTLIAVLTMGGTSAGLQVSTSADSLKTPELAKVTVRRVVVSLSDRKLALLRDGQLVKIYRVAIGRASTPSPVGEFKIVNRVANPAYYHSGQVIPAGKNNPVGSRWMGLSANSYGIHGTNQPSSIGKAASTGCIRMGRRDLEELFTLVEVGDAVEIRAERDERIAAIFGSDTETIAQATASAAGGAGGQ
jgi:lipoprotein-anchoring transpeptidase ErfK/SrfK